VICSKECDKQAGWQGGAACAHACIQPSLGYYSSNSSTSGCHGEVEQLMLWLPCWSWHSITNILLHPGGGVLHGPQPVACRPPTCRWNSCSRRQQQEQQLIVPCNICSSLPPPHTHTHTYTHLCHAACRPTQVLGQVVTYAVSLQGCFDCPCTPQQQQQE
jgi:hypothetical protein